MLVDCGATTKSYGDWSRGLRGEMVDDHSWVVWRRAPCSARRWQRRSERQRMPSVSGYVRGVR